MPKYRYQCACGVQFDARNTIARSTEAKPCPDCRERADRMMPTDIAGHFNKDVDGPGPQNTGIHDLDTHIDRVIGQSAKQGMEVIEHRQRVKREMIQRGVDAKRIGRLPDGTYAENSEEEQDFAIRANRINSRAMSYFEKKKPASEQ